ncbi:tripartite tricarboxylate transporter substrate-binding protein [Falsiroseomonas stagni]|uniref:Tripartite-type tricarboxylate transporter, receptor component TctC n=1 Tax=Falsiroseomonas stagni DSM 19981 TaxID=1123062 RepID=A0A1I3XUP5_9PROT|nr:tripartite tricarboxylate transporter substrate-binding protein [Falsiroseomonas stagni]SFK22781.1 Tripartite-type tricarboxylate transporter, receptor component TctC [Falsiroseomonas stagni DSM 19981]
MTHSITRAAFLSGLATLAMAAPARAQQRPLRLVLPYAPGGVVDTLGRVVGMALAETAGIAAVADNRPGAGGMIGTDHVAKSAPDGTTALVMDPAVVINPSLQANVPYDLFRDLTCVSIISSSPLVVVAAPNQPFRTMQELVAFGRTRPGALTFASAGVGTTPHLAGELLNLRTGINATHVPYRGIAAAMPDVMSGAVPFTFSSIAGARGLIADGRLRAIATTGTTRPSSLRDVPTLAESGFADFVVDLWLGVFVPSATPAATIASLHAALQTALRRPETATAFERAGAEVRFTTTAESERTLRSEYEMWRNLITTQRITAG